jgi:hypothetical protein
MIDKYTFDDPACTTTILSIVAILCLSSFATGFIVGGNIRDDVSKRTAVKAGAAKWVSDQEGNAEFQWIINGEKK